VRSLRSVSAAAMTLLVGTATAQTVTTVSANSATLDAGTRQGVRIGMTGKLCRSQNIGGRNVDVCPAAFRIDSVTKEAAVATITRGETAQVQNGLHASFDQHLTREQPKSKALAREPVAPAPASEVVTLLADAELALDRGDSDVALGLFRRLLKKMPEDEYLARRAADAARHVDAPKTPPRTIDRAEEALVDELNGAIRSSRSDVERGTARKILELNPANTSALTVRARSRALTWNRARSETTPWSRVTIWQEHLGYFSADDPAAKEIDLQTQKTVADLARLSDQSCDAVTFAVNAVPSEIRSSNWFPTAVASAARSWTSCRFAGLPVVPTAREFKLVMITLRQLRPLPGAAVDLSLPGESSTSHTPLAGKDAPCRAEAPCDHQFALAKGEHYQLSILSSSFRNRSEPLVIIGPSTPSVLCIIQKLTKLAIEACAASP
jgi:hypothetical protein